MRPHEAEFRGTSGGTGEKMAKHLLSAIAVKNAAEGDLNDGEGLVLRVKSTGASWVLRYTAASAASWASGRPTVPASRPPALL